MTNQNPNRPTGTGTPPEGDRVGGGPPPPEYRGGSPRGDGGNSAMALIVGALAVVLIIGAFFWFTGDTQETATLDDPTITQEDTLSTEPVPDQDRLGTTDQDTTMTEEPAMEEDVVIDESQQGTTVQPQDEQVIDETQQN
jgi:hypothetical protein